MAIRNRWRPGAVAVALLCVPAAAEWQPPQTRNLVIENADVNRTLTSPEVLPDGRVTFRIYAPFASEVLVGGDWLQPAPPPPLPMAKDDKGVWAASVGPLAPDHYLYWFRVDGVMTPDPKNPVVEPRAGSAAGASPQNILSVPGAGAEFLANKDVPHGEVRQRWYRSGTLGGQRRMHVYTPPDYDSTGNSYPTLYLLHGGGELDSTWSGLGRAGFIIDNLIAAKQATPMVIVMPEVPAPPARARVGEELLNDIMPYVEKHYRVRADRNHKALAGFSVGGYETLRMLTAHPERFAYFAVWGAPVEGKTVAAFAAEWARFLTDADRINRLLKRVSFRIGAEDMGAPHVRKLSALLREHGITHDLQISGGGHRWQNWRRYLHEYAQVIFP